MEAWHDNHEHKHDLEAFVFEDEPGAIEPEGKTSASTPEHKADAKVNSSIVNIPNDPAAFDISDTVAIMQIGSRTLASSKELSQRLFNAQVRDTGSAAIIVDVNRATESFKVENPAMGILDRLLQRGKKRLDEMFINSQKLDEVLKELEGRLERAMAEATTDMRAASDIKRQASTICAMAQEDFNYVEMLMARVQSDLEQVSEKLKVDGGDDKMSLLIRQKELDSAMVNLDRRRNDLSKRILFNANLYKSAVDLEDTNIQELEILRVCRDEVIEDYRTQVLLTIYQSHAERRMNLGRSVKNMRTRQSAINTRKHAKLTVSMAREREQGSMDWNALMSQTRAHQQTGKRVEAIVKEATNRRKQQRIEFGKLLESDNAYGHNLNMAIAMGKENLAIAHQNSEKSE